MASLKDVRDKIEGVKKTKQITKAMNMVASAKLRGAQQRIDRFRPYAEKFHEVLGELAGKSGDSLHPLLAQRDVKTVGIILVTSDRGLCGSFNINLINEAIAVAKQCKQEGKNAIFYCVGKKGRDALARLELPICMEMIGQMGALDFQVANKLSLEILQAFISEKVDEVQIIYGKFISVGRQDTVRMPLLPIEQAHEGTEVTSMTEYTYEPSVEDLLAELLPRFVKVQVYRGMLDTSTSEHAARMTAMDNATRNCDDIASQLTLLFNKTRQAAITTDLIDIVSGAGALNG